LRPVEPPRLTPEDGKKLGGAIGGGVITYAVNGALRIAVTTGFTSPVWPVVVTTGKVAILGVEADAESQ
jgi:alcohol dehydrogenase (cytochrome c)